MLVELGERFFPQKGFCSRKGHFIVDFYLPKRRKLCLEVDGGYHSNPTQTEYDRRRTEFLVCVRGFRVVRISSVDAMKIDASGLLALIQ